MIIKIKAKPNSERQEIVKSGESYTAYLKSSPEDGKANAELLKLLKKYFGSQAKIKSGFTSRNKIVEIIEK